MRRYRLTAPPHPLDRPGQLRRQARVLLAGDEEELVFEGDSDLVELVRERLLASYGFRGRPIEPRTSLMDLEIAMGSWQMQPFEPVLES